MKEKVKSAVNHKVSIRNKAVPTLGIAALVLMLVGGASAAVLANFAEVNDTSTVSQSIIVNDTTTFDGGQFTVTNDATQGLQVDVAGQSDTLTLDTQNNVGSSQDVSIQTRFVDTSDSTELSDASGLNVTYDTGADSISHNGTDGPSQTSTLTVPSGQDTLDVTLDTALDVDGSTFSDLKIETTIDTP